MKRLHSYVTLAALLLVSACSSNPASFNTRNASGHYSPEIVQCAIYARDVSGVGLYGDADGWWRQAGTRYLRGNKPKQGAVLVLKRTSRMPSGHVAVVRDVIGRRVINVTHSNWGSDRNSRHIIYDSMRVEDVSPRGDWSVVRFWNNDKGVFGFNYAAYGFIYP